MLAYRTLPVPVELDEELIEVTIPFNLRLLQRVEETMEKLEKTRGWLGRGSVLGAFREFAEPYLPDSIERERIQPAFYPSFFFTVKDALLSSLNESTKSASSTAASSGPTAKAGKEDLESEQPRP